MKKKITKRPKATKEQIENSGPPIIKYRDNMKIEKKTNALKPRFAKISIDKNQDVLYAFTDGATQGNGKAINVGGYGFLVVEGDKVLHQYTRRIENTTNNKCELQGIIDCMEYLEDNKIWGQVIIHSDSQYCIHGICSWRHGWIKRNWENVKNVEQWKHLSNLVNLLPNVQYKWIRAHQTDSSMETKYNCMVDELIQECMFGKKQEDKPYKPFISREEDAKIRQQPTKKMEDLILEQSDALLLTVYENWRDDKVVVGMSQIQKYLQSKQLI